MLFVAVIGLKWKRLKWMVPLAWCF